MVPDYNGCGLTDFSDARRARPHSQYRWEPSTTKTPTGSVTFSIGTTTLGTVVLSGGAATLSNVTVSTADEFSVGSDTITASYSGNASFAASAGSTALTVTTDPTTITVSATPDSVMLGGATKLTASVSSSTAGAITWTVTFTIGATTLGNASVSNGHGYAHQHRGKRGERIQCRFGHDHRIL